MHILSKSTYIKGEQCMKALYLHKKHPYLRDRLSVEQRAKFQRGTNVGILARSYFPGGINMAPSSPSLFDKKVAETMQNLSNTSVNVMYEAVFQYNDTLIMLDILVREGDKWKAVEVKSSMALSETYYKDAALQYYVLKGCGIPLSDFQLMYINPNYVRNGELNLSELFVFKSVVEFTEKYQPTISRNIKEFIEMLSQPHAPSINIGEQCDNPYRCDFHGFCWKNSSASDMMRKSAYMVNYRKLYILLGEKSERTAYLDLLFDQPAVPLLDGDKPYQLHLIGFAVTDDEGKTFTWNCFEDYAKQGEGYELLVSTLERYKEVVCFTPQNINAILLKLNIPNINNVIYKIRNFRDMLKEAEFSHPHANRIFSFQKVYEAVFPDKDIFEHERILVNAKSDNPLDRSLAIDDLEAEVACIKELYLHFSS